MSIIDSLKNMLTASAADRRSYWVYARCQRCGEVISSRVDLFNDLSRDFDAGHYTVNKVLVGSGGNRCFQRIDITLVFDAKKRLVDRSITGGEFLHPEQVGAAKAAYEQAIAEAKARAEAEREEQRARIDEQRSMIDDQ